MSSPLFRYLNWQHNRNKALSAAKLDLSPLNDSTQTITMRDANGNEVTMATSGVMISSNATVTVNASVVQINSGTVNVAAGLAKFDGIVQCDMLISNSVVSTTYTSRAGNIW